jgi:PIN domain nuclease of toxin-antitoxin system
MNYLLDTHTFLWTIFNKNKLTKEATVILLDQRNTIYISKISFWEISLKFALGKISFHNVSPEALPDVALKSGFEILDLTVHELASFHRLKKSTHKDPFDRLIIWQAINNKFTLISKDKTFQDYKNFGLKVIW